MGVFPMPRKLAPILSGLLAPDEEQSGAPQIHISKTLTVSRPVPVELRRPRTQPALTMLSLMLSDLAALMASICAVVLVRHHLGGAFHPSLYWQLWPVLGLFLLAFVPARLYTVPLNAAEEIRRVTLVTTAIYFGLGTVTFLLREALTYSRSIFLLAWFVSIVSILSGRGLLRATLARQAWWGFPVLVLGCGKIGRRLVRTLLSQPSWGLKPVGILDDRIWRRRGFKGVPILGSTSRVLEIVRKYPQLRVLVITAEISHPRLNQLLLAEQQCFGHLLIVPDMHGITSVGVKAHELAGILGLHVRHRLLDPIQVLIKRLLDLFLLIVLSPIALLLMLILAVVIKIDSKGPVFFRQARIGLDGLDFKVLKFRTMATNADHILAERLTQNPKMASEWQRNQKITKDPRITRVGRFLRRTSLDELPQIWNVLRGQMSIVGPRPIVQDEIERYGPNFALYVHVRPGITGLWQVSGRSNLTYDDRVRLDVHYVRNWSIWLDLHILCRTLLEIITGRGAF